MKNLNNSYTFNKNKTLGFTLVEIVISIAILGLLSVGVISVVNQRQQQERAEDAVRRSRIEQLSLAMESFYASEGRFPKESGGIPDDDNLQFFVAEWPADVQYRVSSDFEDFAVYAPESNNNFIKYSTILTDVNVCSGDNIEDIGTCVDPYGGPPTPTLSHINVTPSINTIEVGNTVQLKAEAFYTDGSSVDVTQDPDSEWYADPESGPIVVGNVSPNKGLVEGESEGEAEAIVKYSGITGGAKVIVTNIASEPILVGVEVEPASVTININEKLQLEAYAIYSDGSKVKITTDPNVLWSTTGTLVTVTSTGLIEGKGVGTQPVTAKYLGFDDSSSVTVESEVIGISLTPAEITIEIGDVYSFKLEALYLDGKKVTITTSTDVAWTTLNNILPTNFTYLGNGQVRAVRAGDAILKATYQGFTDESVVTIVSQCQPGQCDI